MFDLKPLLLLRDYRISIHLDQAAFIFLNSAFHGHTAKINSFFFQSLADDKCLRSSKSPPSLTPNQTVHLLTLTDVF